MSKQRLTKWEPEIGAVSHQVQVQFFLAVYSQRSAQPTNIIVYQASERFVNMSVQFLNAQAVYLKYG